MKSLFNPNCLNWFESFGIKMVFYWNRFESFSKHFIIQYESIFLISIDIHKNAINHFCQQWNLHLQPVWEFQENQEAILWIADWNSWTRASSAAREAAKPVPIWGPSPPNRPPKLPRLPHWERWVPCCLAEKAGGFKFVAI